jgi:hypothetical protein
MKSKALLILVPMLMLLTSLGHAQQQRIEAGLWEITVTIQSQSGEVEQAMREMQEQLAALPPEQRQMMEQMMAQQGISMDGTTSTYRICITPEEAKLDGLHFGDEECDHEIVQRSRNTLKVRFTCKDEEPPSSGEGEFTIVSPTEYRGKALINTFVDGRPEQIQINQVGRRIAADCGDVAPAR